MLLPADSFGPAMQPNPALSSRGLTHSGALRGERRTDLKMADLVEEHDIDIVVFVARLFDFASFTTRNPN